MRKSSTAVKQVLILDNEKMIRVLLKHCFKSLRPSYQVVTTATGLQALEQLQQQRFDLAIVGCQLSDMNSLDVVLSMRRSLPEIRIKMISGSPPPEVSYAIEQRIIDGYLPKPFTYAKLLGMIDQFE